MTSINLIKVNNNGTIQSMGSWIYTNDRGWYVEQSTGCVALSLERLSYSVSQRTGRYVMISAHC